MVQAFEDAHNRQEKQAALLRKQLEEEAANAKAAAARRKAEKEAEAQALAAATTLREITIQAIPDTHHTHTHTPTHTQTHRQSTKRVVTKCKQSARSSRLCALLLLMRTTKGPVSSAKNRLVIVQCNCL